MRTSRRSQRGLTLIEMLIALALLGFILLGILPLFFGSMKSNFSASEYTSIHNLCRDRLEQLMNLPFNDAQLTPGIHFPTGGARSDDLPPVLPDPATGVPPATGGVLNPLTLSYQVMQYQAPSACDPALPATDPRHCPGGITGVLAGQAFTPVRVGCGACAIPPGSLYHYKRIDVTVLSTTGPLGIGARVAKVSGIVMNPSLGVNLAVADPGP